MPSTSRSLQSFHGLFHSRPHTVLVVVFFERLQELADFLPLVFSQFGEHFGDVADFAGDDGDPVRASHLEKVAATEK